MRIELYCANCDRRFTAPPDMAAEQIIDRMSGERSWYGLGEGETFEDMIFSSLTEDGDIRCPQCGEPVQVSEESLGRMAMEMLARW
jgi:DNA-directed RNA polymerase subunit RPC12/RpoP